MVSTARSIEITKVRQFKSRVLMYSYATRGLGFLVRCATISRQLGQRSGGSPLFMINHRSSWASEASPTLAILLTSGLYVYVSIIYVYVRRCPPKPPTHAHMLDLWF